MENNIDPWLKDILDSYMNLFSKVYGNINKTLTDRQRESILIKLEQIRKIIVK